MPKHHMPSRAAVQGPDRRQLYYVSFSAGSTITLVSDLVLNYLRPHSSGNSFALKGSNSGGVSSHGRNARTTFFNDSAMGPDRGGGGALLCGGLWRILPGAGAQAGTGPGRQ